MSPFDDVVSKHAKALRLEQQRAEIERAIKNVKRSAWDKWFRREWSQDWRDEEVAAREGKRCKKVV
jgi:phage gpG-like protein